MKGRAWLSRGDIVRISRFFFLASILLSTGCLGAKAETASADSAAPVFSPTGFDAEFYGQPLGYPAALPIYQQSNMVGGFSRYDYLFPTRAVAASAQPSILKRAAQGFSASFTRWGVTYSIEDYLKRNAATGLLIARGDTILFEHYQYGRTDRDRLTSQSLVKTMVGMLVGIAISEGAIRSVDDPAAAYVPELAGSELGRTPLRALLHMASGIGVEQDYNPDGDLTRDNRLRVSGDTPNILAALPSFAKRVAPPDTLWRYANVNAEVLGLVLVRATRMSLSAYLESRIWQPMGAEAQATWRVDASGQEVASCCFNAVLRDYARFALLLAHDGAWNGRQIIPRQWLLDATEPVEAGSFRAFDKTEHPSGYGYLVWLMPGPRRTFVMNGINGQRIFIDPQSQLVMVHTAVRRQPVDDPREEMLVSLWQSVLAQQDP
jgi:CubicO group peptidase (beta-lactamase class C family)